MLQLVGGKEGLQRENRIKELEQELSRSNEVSLRLQRDLADANAKLATATGAPPANLKKQTPPTDGVRTHNSTSTFLIPIDCFVRTVEGFFLQFLKNIWF